MTATLDSLAARPAREALDPAAVAAALAAAPDLAGWRVDSHLGTASTTTPTTPPQLAITYATGDFAAALDLANRIGAAAEAADHHPDLTVSYGRLEVRMHSHDVGALTSRDLRLARTVAALAVEALAPHALAVYGTLAPGRPNAHVMDGMDGSWTPGTTRGVLHDGGWGAAAGYPGIVLPASLPQPAGDVVDVPTRLFVSADLPAHWARLDGFEGPGYRRVPVPVRLPGSAPGDDAVRPAFIYELAPDAVPPAPAD